LLDNQVFSSLVWRKTDNLPHLFLGVFLHNEGNYWTPYFSENKRLMALIFDGMKSFHHRKLLQHKINYYASVLLSKYWHIVTQTFVLIKDLMESIKQDLFPTNIEEKVIKDFGQQTNMKSLGVL
jgi:glucose-6-phosphate-specific signal transduction histidine kinase